VSTSEDDLVSVGCEGSVDSRKGVFGNGVGDDDSKEDGIDVDLWRDIVMKSLFYFCYTLTPSIFMGGTECHGTEHIDSDQTRRHFSVG
jgi:hypothetical protein